MTSRFTNPVDAGTQPLVSRQQARSNAQQRAYARWEDELKRKHRSRLGEDAEHSHQDYTLLEHLADAEDVERLEQLLLEEYQNANQAL